MPLIIANTPKNNANVFIAFIGEKKSIIPNRIEIMLFIIRNILSSELKALISVNIPTIINNTEQRLRNITKLVKGFMKKRIPSIANKITSIIKSFSTNPFINLTSIFSL